MGAVNLMETANAAGRDSLLLFIGIPGAERLPGGLLATALFYWNTFLSWWLVLLGRCALGGQAFGVG